MSTLFGFVLNPTSRGDILHACRHDAAQAVLLQNRQGRTLGRRPRRDRVAPHLGGRRRHRYARAGAPRRGRLRSEVNSELNFQKMKKRKRKKELNFPPKLRGARSRLYRRRFCK